MEIEKVEIKEGVEIVEVKDIGIYKIPEKDASNILDIINKEFEKSRNNGLDSNEIIIKLVKYFFLCLFEQWGGFKKTKTKYDSVSATKYMEKRMNVYFPSFNLENNKMYLIHLEEVKKQIIDMIYIT